MVVRASQAPDEKISVQVEKAMRASVQAALDRERAHCRQVHAQLDDCQRALRAASAAAPLPLSAEEEAAIRGAHEEAVGRERASAAVAVREMRTLSERAVQDGSAALQARLAAERDACTRHIANIQVPSLLLPLLVSVGTHTPEDCEFKSALYLEACFERSRATVGASCEQ
jgi:hypothetical protein